MEITCFDKLAVLARVLLQTRRMPSLRQKVAHLLCPVDSTRYTEFAFLLRCLKEYDIRPCRVLDVSSPFQLAYVLSEKAHVIKTDINPAERKNIHDEGTLTFRQEDATRLSFPDRSFDFVYSISVIEHIYGAYLQAVREMLRVLQPGGHLYLTFPVAGQCVEEWVDAPVYSHQHAAGDRVFFQYRFGEAEVVALLAELGDAEVVDFSIYWERRNGAYDAAMSALLETYRIKPVHEVCKGLLNFKAGFTVLEDTPADFSHARPFGNASLLVRKGAGLPER